MSLFASALTDAIIASSTRAMTAAKAGGKGTPRAEPMKRPPRKKTKSTKDAISVPKRQTKLSFTRLLDLPPEVFSEVARHLLPADLLSLARSNKFFRKLLMSRTSRPLWKSTIYNVPDVFGGFGVLVILNAADLVLEELWRAGTALDGSLPSCSFMQKDSVDLRDRSYRPVGVDEPWKVQFLIPSELIPYHGPPSTVMSIIPHMVGALKEDYALMFMYGAELDGFLQAEEDKREAEDHMLKCQRRNQIKERIVENGWTDRDMVPSPGSSIEWRKLVVQPKLLTDRTWANLYPKLAPLLKANREHRELLERQQRRWKRIQRMQTMATSLRDELPPFITVSRLYTPEVPSSEPSTSSMVSNFGRRDLTIRFSFPNVPELLSWPMIKDIIEEDTSPEEAESKLTAIREDVARAVVEWRNKLEQDLVDIWNTGRIEGKEGEEASDAKGKGKVFACTAEPSGGRGDAKESASELKSREVELTLPEFTVTFTKPDGTTTTNLADLSPNLQVLLRADTVFKGDPSNSNYPTIVPPLIQFDRMMPGAEELYLGVRWDRGKLKRDDEAVAISKELLARVGKPDATSAEMRALRGNFQCGQCTSTLPVLWDRLVDHFSREEAQWKLSQLIKEANPELQLVYNRTHSLDPEDNQPFAHFLTREESADRMLQVSTYDMPVMRCLKCDDVGIDSRYLDLHGDFDIDSPILEHLREVHNVSSPISGFHYCEWEWYVADSDPSDEDQDDESGSEDEIEM
ncbi:hypothetical protein RhiJN_15008 [Ceratobasidium sp. AG-Ba]|nr:hypothetical protein RhiJN_15008 [Ceratobasidium sp. AG-Ba]